VLYSKTREGGPISTYSPSDAAEPGLGNAALQKGSAVPGTTRLHDEGWF